MFWIPHKHFNRFWSGFHSVRSTLSLRAKIRGPRGILCTRGEKEYASIRQPTVVCDSRLVKREAYDASPGREPYYKTHARYFCTCVEKKAQTSIRVSIAAPTMRFQQRSLRLLPCMNFGKCSICWKKFKKTYENIWICALNGRKLHKNGTFLDYYTI